MILGHEDSHGNRWVFRIDGTADDVAKIAHDLKRKAARVRRFETLRRPRALSVALLYEAVTLADLYEEHGATLDDWDAAPRSERFLL